MLIGESGPCAVSMACHFQAVNEGLIAVTQEEGAKLTAQGQVFRAMSRHAGGKLLFSSSGCVVTAGEDGAVTATVINDAWNEEMTLRLPKAGGCAEATLLTGESVLPPSWFRETDVRDEVCSGKIVLPPHSFLLLTLTNAETV